MRNSRSSFGGKDFFALIRSISPPSEIYLGLITSSLFINILSIAFPLMLLQIYDRIIPNTAIYTLLILTLAVSSAIILEGVLRYLRAWITAWIDARLEHTLGFKTFSNILNSQINNYELMGTGVYLEHLNSIHTLKDFYSSQVITSVLDIPFIFVFLFLIFYIAGWLGFIPIIILIALTSSAFLVSQHLSRALESKRHADDKRINFIISALSGIHYIKSMALEMQMLRRYERIQDNMARNDYQLGLNNSMASLLTTNTTQASTAFILIFGSIMVIHGNLTIGGLAACVLLTNRILLPATRAISVWARLQSVKLALKRIDEVAHLPQEKGNELPKIPTIKGNLSLEDISFRYNPDSPFIFTKLNLLIKAGEIIGINSKNLTGKSSLLWLMMGILQPASGRVLIDGQDISLFNQESIRKQIAYIPQQGVLFNGTILENITLFRPILNKQAKKISELLALSNDIHQLPKGYETLVGKTATETLSVGLKQRICIARALLTEPRIILFDEANAAIDMRSDTILKSVLSQYRGQCTWVLVSHRPSLLKLSDYIYALDHGQLKIAGE